MCHQTFANKNKNSFWRCVSLESSCFLVFGNLCNGKISYIVYRWHICKYLNIYPSSHNHGSQKWVPPIVVTFQIYVAIFYWTMIMGERVISVIPSGCFSRAAYVLEHLGCGHPGWWHTWSFAWPVCVWLIFPSDWKGFITSGTGLDSFEIHHNCCQKLFKTNTTPQDATLTWPSLWEGPRRNSQGWGLRDMLDYEICKDEDKPRYLHIFRLASHPLTLPFVPFLCSTSK